MKYIIIGWVAFSIGMLGVHWISWQFWAVIGPVIILFFISELMKETK